MSCAGLNSDSGRRSGSSASTKCPAGVRLTTNFTYSLTSVGIAPAPRVLSQTHTNRHIHTNNHTLKHQHKPRKWNFSRHRAVALQRIPQNNSLTHNSTKTPNNNIKMIHTSIHTKQTNDNNNFDNKCWGGKEDDSSNVHHIKGMSFKSSNCLSIIIFMKYLFNYGHINIHIYNLGVWLGRDHKHTGRDPTLMRWGGRSGYLCRHVLSAGQVGPCPGLS